MTCLEDCYMLPVETKLNFEQISEIKDQGYSRIPIFKEDRTNIVHILFAKDLLFLGMPEWRFMHISSILINVEFNPIGGGVENIR